MKTEHTTDSKCKSQNANSENGLTSASFRSVFVRFSRSPLGCASLRFGARSCHSSLCVSPLGRHDAMRAAHVSRPRPGREINAVTPAACAAGVQLHRRVARRAPPDRSRPHQAFAAPSQRETRSGSLLHRGDEPLAPVRRRWARRAFSVTARHPRRRRRRRRAPRRAPPSRPTCWI